VTAVAFRPGSHEFATAQRDGTISRWNADESQQAGVALSGHNSAVSALAWTPDGGKLASVDRDGGVLLQHGNGTSIARVEIGRSLTDLRFSPDGQVLVGTAPKELVLIQIGDLRLFAIAAVWMDGSPVEIVAYDEDGDVDGSPEAMARLHGARGRRDGLLRALLGQ
jgi:WD40 repeat protein